MHCFIATLEWAGNILEWNLKLHYMGWIPERHCFGERWMEMIYLTVGKQGVRRVAPLDTPAAPTQPSCMLCVIWASDETHSFNPVSHSLQRQKERYRKLTLCLFAGASHRKPRAAWCVCSCCCALAIVSFSPPLDFL
jgi:hypothetical protein